MEDIFDSFGDIFGGFSGFSGRSSGRNRVLKGSNLRIRIKLDLKDICEGTVKKIKVKKLIQSDGVSFSTCSTCMQLVFTCIVPTKRSTQLGTVHMTSFHILAVLCRRCS